MFETYQARLTYLAASLSTLRVELAGSSDKSLSDLGFRGQRLFLPATVSLFHSKEENYDVVVFRLIGELQALEAILPGAAAGSHHRDFTNFMSNVVARLLRVVEQKGDSAILARRLLKFDPPSQADVQALALKAVSDGTGDGDGAQSEGASRRTKKPGAPTRVVDLKDEDMNPLVHVFEKIQTLDDYTGGNKQIDGSDELSDHGRALEDLDLNTVVRTNKTGAGILAGTPWTDGTLDSTGPDAARGKVFRYREWHAGKRKYQSDWCHVRETLASAARLNQDSNEIFAACKSHGALLNRRLAFFFNSYQWRRRQLDGPELDLQSLLDTRVEQARGGQPDEKIYIARVRANLDFGLTVLCDASLSTESWINGQQVRRIVQDAAVMLSFGLSGLACPWSVAAFNSFTRHECSYRILKDFDETADAVRRNVAELAPNGYTRIGPALRHAGFRLASLRAKRNMVIVVTDAKPSDYDHYEGSYGVQDVRRAIMELKAQNIQTFAVAVGGSVSQQTIQMFGHATAASMSSDQLSNLLTDIFVRFIGGKRG